MELDEDWSVDEALPVEADESEDEASVPAVLPAVEESVFDVEAEVLEVDAPLPDASVPDVPEASVVDEAVDAELDAAAPAGAGAKPVKVRPAIRIGAQSHAAARLRRNDGLSCLGRELPRRVRRSLVKECMSVGTPRQDAELRQVG